MRVRDSPESSDQTCGESRLILFPLRRGKTAFEHDVIRSDMVSSKYIRTISRPLILFHADTFLVQWTTRKNKATLESPWHPKNCESSEIADRSLRDVQEQRTKRSIDELLEKRCPIDCRRRRDTVARPTTHGKATNQT